MSVNLRAAEIDNFWRRWKQRKYSTALESLNFIKLACLKDGTLCFHSGITAVIGANGVGKSTAAAAIADVLVGVQSDPQYIRVLGSKLDGAGTYQGKVAKFHSSDAEPVAMSLLTYRSRRSVGLTQVFLQG